MAAVKLSDVGKRGGPVGCGKVVSPSGWENTVSATVQTWYRCLSTSLLTGMLALCAGCSDSSDDYVSFDALPGNEETSIAEDAVTGMKIMSVKLPPGPGVPVAGPDETMQADFEPGTATDSGAENVAGEESVAGTVETAGAAPGSEDNSTGPQPGADSEAASDVAAAARNVRSEQSGLTGPADKPTIDQGAKAAAGESQRAIELLIPSKRFLKERGTEAMRVTYDDIDLLKILNMEPVPPDAQKYFPDWLEALDGSVVRIRGFMYPTFLATGLTEFAMARDNGICCFVRQPKIYDIISVSLDEGETTDYIANRPFDVEGVFRIDPESDDTSLTRLYRIERARVLQ